MLLLSLYNNSGASNNAAYDEQDHLGILCRLPARATLSALMSATPSPRPHVRSIHCLTQYLPPAPVNTGGGGGHRGSLLSPGPRLDVCGIPSDDPMIRIDGETNCGIFRSLDEKISEGCFKLLATSSTI